MNDLYGGTCADCPGRVRTKVLRSIALPVDRGEYVILERVPVGVCDRCRVRYYHSSVLKQAEEAHRTGGARTRRVPVARYRFDGAARRPVRR